MKGNKGSFSSGCPLDEFVAVCAAPWSVRLVAGRPPPTIKQDMPGRQGVDTCALQEALRDCNQHVHDLQHRLRKAVRDFKSSDAAKKMFWRRALNVAFILFACTAPEHVFDIEYLRRRCDGMGDIDLQQAAHDLESRFLSESLEHLYMIQKGESTTLSKVLFREAARFEQEAVLYKWIRCQNIDQGLAPSPKLAIAFRRSLDCKYRTDSVAPRAFLSTEAGERKWLQRFRRRWGISLGKVPAGDVLPLPALQQKAFSIMEKAVKSMPFRNSQCQTMPKRGAHIMVPLLGTIC